MGDWQGNEDKCEWGIQQWSRTHDRAYDPSQVGSCLAHPASSSWKEGGVVVPTVFWDCSLLTPPPWPYHCESSTKRTGDSSSIPSWSYNPLKTCPSTSYDHPQVPMPPFSPCVSKLLAQTGPSLM
eukprot:3559652-Pyramimonas_sp.AAC.1